MNYNIIYLVVVALLVALASNLTTKYTVDMHKMKALKEKMEKLQKKIKERKKDMSTEEMKKLIDEQYTLMLQQMKYSFKSSIYSAAFALPAFYLLAHWMKNELFQLPYPFPFIGNHIGWITLYIFYIVLFSLLIKKVLNLTY